MREKVLYIVPARLGDAVMTTPVVTLIKHYQPELTLDILAVSPLGASVYQNNPRIGNVYNLTDIEDLKSFSKDYTQAFLTHVDKRTLEAASALDIPLVQAEDADEAQGQAAQSLRFIHHYFNEKNKKFPFEKLAYELYPSQVDKAHIHALLTQALGNIEKYKLIGCHIGCHGIAKSSGVFRKIFKKKTHRKVWPLKHFLKLERLLLKLDPTIRFVITGGPGETELANAFMKKSKSAINLCSQTTTLQLAALMGFLNAYITSDTGALHVACATNVNLIALFGPTNLMRTGPYPKTAFRHILQKDPLSELSPETVMNVIKKYI